MTPLPGDSPAAGGAGETAKLDVTERVRTSPWVETASAGPLSREAMPRRWNGGRLTRSRTVSTETLWNTALTLPLTGMTDGGLVTSVECGGAWRGGKAGGGSGCRRRARRLRRDKWGAGGAAASMTTG